jgi:23S rRNA (uridine2552-2'-O)-methyltransferase
VSCWEYNAEIMNQKPPLPFAGKRDLTVRVKTADKRKISSTRWLERQLNDPYVKQAKRDGYHSRAAYKLLEIDSKYGLLKAGAKVVDLGAAPGGWSQVAAKATNANDDKPNIIAMDLLPMQAISGVQFWQGDMQDEGAAEHVAQMLGGKANVVLSDMGPNTTGHASTDHMRIMILCEIAYDFAVQVLCEGGAFVCKVRQGGTEGALLQKMKQRFVKVAHFKPNSSRQESPETYVVAIGFRG